MYTGRRGRGRKERTTKQCCNSVTLVIIVVQCTIIKIVRKFSDFGLGLAVRDGVTLPHPVNVVDGERSTTLEYVGEKPTELIDAYSALYETAPVFDPPG